MKKRVYYEVHYWDDEAKEWEWYFHESNEENPDEMYKVLSEAITIDRDNPSTPDNKDCKGYRLVRIEETLLSEVTFDDRYRSEDFK